MKDAERGMKASNSSMATTLHQQFTARTRVVFERVIARF